MVNKAAKKAAYKEYDEDKDDMAYGRKVKYKILKISSPNKRKENSVHNVTIAIPDEWKLGLWLHHFKGKKGLKVPVICPIKQYKSRGTCEFCESEGDYGPCKPRFHWVYLGYVHSYAGKKIKINGRKFTLDPRRVLEFPAGRDEETWDVLRELEEKKKLNKAVIQVKRKRGLKLAVLDDDDVAALANKGKIPKEVRTEFGELDEDSATAHILNAYKGADFEYWQVEPPEVSDKDSDDDEDEDEEEKDDDAEEDEAVEDDDEDDEEDSKSKKRSKTKAKAKSKTKAKSSKRASKDDSEDEEDDSDDEDDDDDEDDESEDDDDSDSEDDDDDEEETKTKRKTNSKAKAKPAKGKSEKSSSKTKKKNRYKPDDDDDEEDEDDESGDDSEEDEDDEPKKPVKRKKKR